MNDTRQDCGIILLGVPRSGTTLLSRLLDAHPAISCPAETYVFTSCGRFLREQVVAEDVRVGVLSGLAFGGIPEERVLERVRELAFSFHSEIAAGQGKRRWASKTPFDTFYLDEVERLCGDSVKYVCIYRHGLDVAASIQELCEANGAYLSDIHEYIKRYPAPLEAFAHLWAEQTRRMMALASARPSSVHTLKYEELTADPVGVMTRLGVFLGEQWSADMIDRALRSNRQVGLGDWKTHQFSKVEESSIGRWRRLTPSWISRLAPILNPVMTALGYTPLPERPLRESDEARRLHSLAAMFAAARRDGEPDP